VPADLGHLAGSDGVRSLDILVGFDWIHQLSNLVGVVVVQIYIDGAFVLEHLAVLHRHDVAVPWHKTVFVSPCHARTPNVVVQLRLVRGVHLVWEVLVL